MKAFIVSLVLIVMVSLGSKVVLDSQPTSASDVFSSENVRL